MGGSAASRITVAGGNFDGTVLGGTGGGENQTLTQAQLPAFKPAITITDPGHAHTTTQGAGTSGSAGASFGGGSNAVSPATTTSNSNTTGITAALTSNLGSGNSHPIVQPTMVLPYILRVI
jgi:microcystin-dependent protein